MNANVEHKTLPSGRVTIGNESLLGLLMPKAFTANTLNT